MPGHLNIATLFRWAAGVFVASLILSPTWTMADEFILKNGKRVEGALLNPDQQPRVTYEIQLATGGSTSVNAQDVLRFVPESAAKRRYRELLPRMPQTADGNWKMAQWCRKKSLSAERALHLEQTIALDPNHESARRALGHRFVDGRWTARDDLMRARGYVKHKGSWTLPHEVALDSERERVELAEKQWRKQVRQWRKQLKKGIDPEAWRNIENISDPLAAPAIADLFFDESDGRLRHLYLDVLSALDSPAAINAMIRCALTDGDEDTRQHCLERLPPRGRPAAILAFTAALARNNHRLVTYAAEGLTFLKDPEVIPHLIDALVTEHKIKISNGNSGQIGTSFGGSSDGSFSGTGLSSGGGGPRFETRAVQNRAVLEALLAVTEGVDFRYDERAWRRWLAESTAPVGLNLRRRD
jgi:uncharacterized membrane protein YgcG